MRRSARITAYSVAVIMKLFQGTASLPIFFVHSFWPKGLFDSRELAIAIIFSYLFSFKRRAFYGYNVLRYPCREGVLRMTVSERLF